MFSALPVIFLLEKQENVLIRALICGPKRPHLGRGVKAGSGADDTAGNGG